jgi:acetyl esterase/lipase
MFLWTSKLRMSAGLPEVDPSMASVRPGARSPPRHLASGAQIPGTRRCVLLQRLSVSWILAAVGAVFAWQAYNSCRPIYRWGSGAVLSFVAAWLFSETPFHHLLGQGLIVALLGAAGALEEWPGLVGLGLSGCSWIVLLNHIRLARKTPVLVEGALRDALGPGYRAQIAPELWSRIGARARLWPIATVYPFRPREVDRIRNLVYARVGEREMLLDIYRHRSRPTGCPTLLYVHGGGWVFGNKNQQGLPTLHRLAARGWVCVTIDYRLSPSATFPEHLLDVKQAIRWIREHGPEYGADPRFLLLVGGSAGAHLASLAALTPNDPEYQPGFPEVDTRVQACISYYGVYDFVDRDQLWPHRSFRSLLEWVVMKRRLAEDPAAFEKASPLYRVREDAPPFFVAHGDRDNLVPVAGARRFAETLATRSRAPVVYLELPGTHHAFEIFPSLRSLHLLNGVERFCAWAYCRHLAAQDAAPSTQDSGPFRSTDLRGHVPLSQA